MSDVTSATIGYILIVWTSPKSKPHCKPRIKILERWKTRSSTSAHDAVLNNGSRRNDLDRICNKGPHRLSRSWTHFRSYQTNRWTARITSSCGRCGKCFKSTLIVGLFESRWMFLSNPTIWKSFKNLWVCFLSGRPHTALFLKSQEQRLVQVFVEANS